MNFVVFLVNLLLLAALEAVKADKIAIRVELALSLCVLVYSLIMKNAALPPYAWGVMAGCAVVGVYGMIKRRRNEG